MNRSEATISYDLDSLYNLLDSEKYSSIGVLVDENTEEHCYPILEKKLPNHFLFKIQSGERFKTIETCTAIWRQMTERGFDRNALLINLGGGVIGDMGGFCAAAFKRGIAFVNIPTTLLSQVDASVGGKLGVDFMGLKNHIGFFQNPSQIIIHADFLATLPERELISGYAEVIKHHLIRDADGWKKLRNTPGENLNWLEIIKHSVAIKSKIVSSDPFEKGERKILNLGHTIGHAIESHLLDTHVSVTHGEAVAAGIICENFIALKKEMISSIEKSDIEAYILSLFGKVALQKRELKQIILHAYQDKKNQERHIRAVLLQSIGMPVWDVEITGEEILNSLEYYQSL